MAEEFKQKILLGFCLVVLFLPVFVCADSEGQITKFFIEGARDIQAREQIPAVLNKVCQKGYFYIEQEWYENLTEDEKETVDQSINALSQELDETVYPQLTAAYGSEWKPGIDNDARITILFHQMKAEVAGYFRSQDEVLTVQFSQSNQREMVYLNTTYLTQPIIKSFLAHEFTHLITFNQKDRLRGIAEEVWLNEARAEYVPTLLGYDIEYQGSNLQKRVRGFLENPSDSLAEWRDQKTDYGIINIFVQYLVEHYGVEILADSLKSSQVGILSINEALENSWGQSLQKGTVPKKFSEIFSDWTIAIFLNDCKIDAKYCYQAENLKNLKIVPSLIFLPSAQKTEFSLNYNTSPWSGNWYRIMGGGGELTVHFQGDTEVQFKVPYVLCQDSQGCSVGFLELDKSQKGEISFGDFDKQYSSLTLIPSVQSKLSGFNGKEPSYDFSIFAKAVPQNQEDRDSPHERGLSLKELQARIAELQAEIAKLRAKIAEILKERISCRAFENNLYYGLKSSEVRCLQEFLKARGKEIYPEGLVTGFFGILTQKAVLRFQEKYASEILIPLGLKKGTGFVGSSTRSKINQLLGF